MNTKIVLASASKYRAASLQRLGLKFSQQPTGIDETPRMSETPASLAARLANEKAQKLVATQANAIIIGCDQTGSWNGQLLHKPGNVEAAQAQLAQMSGQRAMFYTAMTVIHVVNGTVATLTHDLDTTELQLRTLSHEQIAAYVAQDNPIDCAGSFKIESLGIILFSAVHSSDPSALEGISLVQLTTRLLDLGVPLGTV